MSVRRKLIKRSALEIAQYVKRAKATNAARKGWETRRANQLALALKAQGKLEEKNAVFESPKKIVDYTINYKVTKTVHREAGNIEHQYVVFEQKPHIRTIRLLDHDALSDNERGLVTVPVPYIQFHFGPFGLQVTCTKKPMSDSSEEVYPAFLPGIGNNGTFCTGNMNSNIGKNEFEKTISAFWHSAFENHISYPGQELLCRFVCKISAGRYASVDYLRDVEKEVKKSGNYLMKKSWKRSLKDKWLFKHNPIKANMDYHKKSLIYDLEIIDNLTGKTTLKKAVKKVAKKKDSRLGRDFIRELSAPARKRVAKKKKRVKKRVKAAATQTAKKKATKRPAKKKVRK